MKCLNHLIGLIKYQHFPQDVFEFRQPITASRCFLSSFSPIHSLEQALNIASPACQLHLSIIYYHIKVTLFKHNATGLATLPRIVFPTLTYSLIIGMARLLLMLFTCLTSVTAQSVIVRNSMMSSIGAQSQTGGITSTSTGQDSEVISISLGITIISSTKGGSSETTVMGKPTMAVGMTHQVC